MPSSANSQLHKIRRQVIELSGCTSGSERELQTRLRNHYYRELLPLIDKICSELSVPGQIQRIDRLEIKLGKVSVDKLGAGLAEPFEAAFREKLAVALGNAPEVDADLELFDFFIGNGTLPWWADAGDSRRSGRLDDSSSTRSVQADPLSASLGRLLSRNPRAVYAVLQTIPGSSRIWQRIAQTYPNELLDKLVGVMMSEAWRHLSIDWITPLEWLSRHWGQSTRVTRNFFWQVVLREAANREQATMAMAPDFYRLVLTQVAHKLGRDYRSLIDTLQDAVESKSVSISLRIKPLIAGFSRDLKAESGLQHPLTESSFPGLDALMEAVRRDMIEALSALENSVAVDAEWWKKLYALTVRLPPTIRTQVRDTLNAISNNAARSLAPNAEVMQKPLATKQQLLALLQTELAEQMDSTLSGGVQPEAPLSGDLTKVLKQLQKPAAADRELFPIDSADSPLWTHLCSLIKRLPASTGKARMLILLDQIDEWRRQANDPQASREADRHQRLSQKKPPAVRDSLITLLRDTLAQFAVSVANSNTINSHTVNKRRGKFDGRLSEKALDEKALNETKSTPIDTHFSEVDETYIGNAGLVVLWPFLPTFFERLGLIEDSTAGKHFVDEAAKQRAVGLLQYLVTAERSPQEIQLPLNKVLCGMAPEAVFDFGPEISAREQQECDDLLTAVIQRAPILDNMSSAGFRGSFLMRQGQLSVCDEQWLLRVQRETHDIVLDRFPWGFGLVKLPWMTAILQVEW